jgi:hypothetical protein
LAVPVGLGFLKGEELLPEPTHYCTIPHRKEKQKRITWNTTTNIKNKYKKTNKMNRMKNNKKQMRLHSEKKQKKKKTNKY